MDNILFNVFVFLAAACIVVPLANRFRLGAVLGYLLAGVAIGPFGLGLIEDAEKVMHFAEFGVVMMLFVIGLELEPAALWRLRKSIIGLGGLQVALSSTAFTLIGMMMGFGWQVSLTVAMALSLSSTALVLQMLEERNLMNTQVGETAFSVLLFQDIAVIPILIVMPLLVAAGALPDMDTHNTIFGDLPGWVHTMAVAAIIGSVIALGRYGSPHLFRTIARTRLREVFTATSLALVVGITLLMELVGVSPALGAFIAGVVLASSEYRHTLESDINPFKGLLLGLFFISVGMGMDFGLLASQPLQILLAVITLLAVKALILFVLGRIFGLLPLHNIGFAFALSQGGEFAFVLFQFAGGLNILPPAQAQFLTLVVALSIAATPLLMLYFNQRIAPKFMSLLPEQNYDIIDANNPIIIAGFGRFGQIISRFLMTQGIKITVLEKDAEQIETLRKFGYKGYFGDATREDLMRSAGAERASMLIIAVDEVDSSLDIATMARREFPSLKIYARARNRQHAYELSKLGVEYFKRETFDSALNMARDIMVALGRKESDMDLKAEQFRRHDEATLVKSFDFFEDEPQLISFSRSNRAELERILQDDKNT